MVRRTFVWALALGVVTAFARFPNLRALSDEQPNKGPGCKPGESAREAAVFGMPRRQERSFPSASGRVERRAASKLNAGGQGTPQWEQALQDLKKEFLRETVKYVGSALKTNDPVEMQLLEVWYRWRSDLLRGFKPEQIEQLFENVFVVRTGKVAGEAETIVLTEAEKPRLGWTRAQARIERPLAILTTSWVVKGRPSQAQGIFVYGPEGRWIALNVKERKERLEHNR